MKKTYQNPETKIVMMNTTCPMLAGSDMGVQGDYDSEKVTIGSRRRGSSWDDDDDEE